MGFANWLIFHLLRMGQKSKSISLSNNPWLSRYFQKYIQKKGWGQSSMCLTPCVHKIICLWIKLKFPPLYFLKITLRLRVHTIIGILYSWHKRVIHHFEKAQVESQEGILAITPLVFCRKRVHYLTFCINTKGNFKLFNRQHWLAYRNIFIQNFLFFLNIMQQNFY